MFNIPSKTAPIAPTPPSVPGSNTSRATTVQQMYSCSVAPPGLHFVYGVGKLNNVERIIVIKNVTINQVLKVEIAASPDLLLSRTLFELQPQETHSTVVRMNVDVITSASKLNKINHTDPVTITVTAVNPTGPVYIYNV